MREAFLKALSGNNPRHMETAIQDGADIFTSVDDHDRKPLHVVQSAQVAQVLLQAGADPNARDQWQRTPLFYADNAKLARTLLADGADAQAVDHAGRTALFTVECADTAQALLDAGIDVNQRDKRGFTAFSHSMPVASIEKLDVLLNAGADILGDTPYDVLRATRYAGEPLPSKKLGLVRTAHLQQEATKAQRRTP